MEINDTIKFDNKSHRLTIPVGYSSYLDVQETEKAIKKIKDTFEKALARKLNIIRVTAPRFVLAGTGINDDLNGIEKAVSFDVPGINNKKAEIVHSLAKWKRMALASYGFKHEKGLYTDMDAIRAQEVLDNLHSIYVDQWDWELVINDEQRSLDYLKQTVEKIYDTIRFVEQQTVEFYPQIKPILPEKITFIHTEDLLTEYPNLSPQEREDAICEKFGAVFLIGIGGTLPDETIHDGRAPDYDDWSTPTIDGKKGLNGDILVYNPVLKRAFEISSMGIRVDKTALRRQLEITKSKDRENLFWHQKLLNDELPLSVGGGIGQSRLCMFYLRKAHIGEIQCGIWPEDMIQTCKKHNIVLL
ncbi:MAG: aspartate--ammonia ligase [Candidatus Hodarchaeales archaeon]|jgi:aspartate--ammonia ligase